MIYLDNAATSFPKPRAVLDKTEKYIRHNNANPGRSAHALAAKSAEEVYLARETVARFIGLEVPERIVFTQNATHALNIAIKTTITKPCHVLTSDFEHNSVIRPLEKLKRDIGIEYSFFSLNGDVYENLSKCIKPETRVVISTLASNVTGKKADVSALSRFCSQMGLSLILDASQLIGHEKIDVSKTPASILCAPGHKALFGLQGSGFVAFCDGKFGDSYMEGGSGVDSISLNMPSLLPERYEAGTLATPSIVSLGAGIKFIENFGIDNVKSKLSELVDTAKSALLNMKDIRLFGAENGIVLFGHKTLHSDEFASLLDKAGICVRGGLHCAPSAHRSLGTLKCGAVRASFSILNKNSDAIRLYEAVHQILKSLK